MFELKFMHMLDYMYNGASQLQLPVSILAKAVNTLESS